MVKARQLYASPNGDRWFLVRQPSGDLFIRHEANAASGGQVENLDLATFLMRAGSGPEHQELKRLLGTLVEHPPEHPTEPPAH
jgi:hypothetical protein